MKKLLIKLNDEIIDQTQGEEAELQIWLSGNVQKYPEGYTAEWIDMAQNYDYQLQECLKSRISEYPSVGEFLNAYFDGGLEELKAKRLEVKAKYPKPEKS